MSASLKEGNGNRGKATREDHEMRTSLVDVADEVTSALDMVTLIYWAGVGIGGEQGTAVARGALLAQVGLNGAGARIRDLQNEMSSRHEAVSVDVGAGL